MNFGAIDLLYKEIDALPIDPEFPLSPTQQP